jgi:hypothetical protein
MDPEVHYCAYKQLPLTIMLSHINPLHTLQYYYF